MNFLGVDYGKKRIGLALSEGMIAQPLSTITVKNQESALELLSSTITQNQVSEIVFGLPIPDQIGAQEFARRLGEMTGVKVVLRDETLSSINALDKLKQTGQKRIKKTDIDAASATLLLQEHLDEKTYI